MPLQLRFKIQKMLYGQGNLLNDIYFSRVSEKSFVEDHITQNTKN
jgi:hypothetical protein